MNILPFIIPPYQTIPQLTGTLAILYAHDSVRAENWICNNCLTMTLQQNSRSNDPHLAKKMDLVYIEPVMSYEYCFLFDIFKIPYDVRIDINEIKKFINMNYYILSSLDCYYIKYHKALFCKQHWSHPTIIYGYQGNELLVADHFIGMDGKYYLEKIDCSIFENGIQSKDDIFKKEDALQGVFLFKYNNNEYRLNEEIIKYLLSCNLHSKRPRSFCKFNEFYTSLDKAEVVSGIKIYEFLINRLLEVNVIDRETMQNLHTIVVHFEMLKLLLDKLHLDLSIANRLEKISKSAKYLALTDMLYADKSSSINSVVASIKTIKDLELELLVNTIKIL